MMIRDFLSAVADERETVEKILESDAWNCRKITRHMAREPAGRRRTVPNYARTTILRVFMGF
jgi:hypothetical protein